MKKIKYVIMDICRAQMYGLNPTETMLVSYLHRFLTDTPLYIDGEAWYNCDFTYIVDNCPVITDKVDTLRRLFRKIEEKGLITSLRLGTRMYFQPSEDMRNWGNSIDEDMIVSDDNSEEREKNPATGKKSVDGKKIPPREKNPSMGKKSRHGKKIPSQEKNPVSLYNNNINNNNNILNNNISSNNISSNNLLNNNNNILLYNNINKENNKERNIKERKKKESEKEPSLFTDKDNEDKSRKRLFRNSGIYVGKDYERLEQMFSGEEYKEIDIVHYYHAVSDWSDSSNTKRTDNGWLATIRNFIRSDIERGKLHKKPTNDDIDPELMAYLKM